MEFLRKKRKMQAVVKKSQGYMKRAKQSGDSARIPMIRMDIEVLVTKALEKILEPALTDALALAKREKDPLPLNSIDISESMPAKVRLYSRANFSKESKPKFDLDDGNRATVGVKRIFLDDDNEPVVLMFLSTVFNAGLWGWCGELLGEGEIVLEFEPSAPDLPFDISEKKDAEGVSAT